MKLVVNKQTIKFNTLEWSGSKFNAARKVVFDFPNKFAYTISQGNLVTLYDGNNVELFQGFVFRKENNHNDAKITVTALDPLVYLLNSSGSFNFKSTSVGAVVKKVAAEVKVPVGSIIDSGTSIKLEPMISSNLYDVLLAALKEAKKKTNKIYLPLISKGKLSVVSSGTPVANFSLANQKNVLNSTYIESIESVKNKIIIVDDDGKKLGEVLGEGLSTWGTFQDVYQKEQGKNATTEAKNLLHGMDREASIEAIGNTNCVSGKAVTVNAPGTNLKGLFYIDEDYHRWEAGKYTMTLELNFKNIEEDDS
jgi:hypothetical protein